jgi:hypothetical protein
MGEHQKYVQPNQAQIVQREIDVWSRRCRGWTLARIAKDLGLSIEGVRKIANRVEERESRRLSRNVHRLKARQNGVHEYVLEESISGWEESKKPRQRVVEKDGVLTTEAVAQTGNTQYLHTALSVMASQRELHGLNVLPQANPYNPTIADLASRLDTAYPAKDQEDEPCPKDTETASPESESDPRN